MLIMWPAAPEAAVDYFYEDTNNNSTTKKQ